jgi:UDPglucose 6-dehydrogenase
VAKLSEGKIPIFEPGLEEIVVRNIKARRLRFSSDSAAAVASSQVIFVAVGTPQGEDGSSDLKYVLEAMRTIRGAIQHDCTVVMKSTVPVGTADKVRDILKGTPHRVAVVSNPEFLKEGTAVNDFLRPERVIIGCDSEQARTVMGDLYAPYVRSGNPILFMSNRSAELCKYAANSFLAMKISFINEMAMLAEKVQADIHDVRRGIVSDSRIGNKFLYPGCGYGGSCFPKDVLALMHLGKELGMPMELFTTVHAINERQKQVLFQKISRYFKNDLKGKTIAVWGLSFKPMTDDMREAPSVTLINQVLAAQGKVRAFDPVAGDEARRLFENKIVICEEAYEAVQKADALAILTEWNEFRSPDFELLKKELHHPAIFDGRNLFNPDSLQRMGFHYYCIGKPDPA